MGLSEAQYKKIIENYDRLRTEHHREELRRLNEVCEKIPGFEELSRRSSGASAEAFRKRLSGNESANTAESLHDTLAGIREQKEKLLLENGFPKDYLEPIFSCPDCRDTGFIGDTPCHCFTEQSERLLQGSSNLELLLKTENFENLSYEYYKGKDLEWFKKAVDCSKSFVRDFSSDYHNLLFFGTVGTGKTFLSCCIAGELMKQGFSVSYYEASEFFDMLSKKVFGKKDAVSEEELFPDCDLLVIDDLGSEVHSQFSSSRLFDLLNARFLRRRPMIISTNLNLRELQERYSNRIFSRIFSQFEAIELSGGDIRINKRFKKTERNS